MLVEKNLFDIYDKIKVAIDLIKEHEPPEGYYVCFSGGKDSVVIYDLVKRAGVKFDAHFNITTVEPPELRRFIKKFYPEVEEVHPLLTMYHLIVKKKILPLSGTRFCCQELKEKGGKDRVKITGIRAEESPRRRKRKIFEPNTRGKGFFLHPIKCWSEKEIWQYIHENNLPYCELYDRGRKRIGCVLCPFQGKNEVDKDLRDYPAIANYYKSACNAVVRNALAEEKQPRFKSGEDMFNWWIDRKKRVQIAKSCEAISLFSEDDGSVL